MSDGRIGCAARSSASACARAGDALSMLGACLDAEPRVVQLAAQVVDQAAAPLDAVERPQHRRDVLLAAARRLRAAGSARRPDRPCVRMRSASATSVCTAPGISASAATRSRCAVLDALADRDLLVRLQQLALADVLQVDADEVDILARHAGLRRLLGFARRLVPRPRRRRPGSAGRRTPPAPRPEQAARLDLVRPTFARSPRARRRRGRSPGRAGASRGPAPGATGRSTRSASCVSSPA